MKVVEMAGIDFDKVQLKLKGNTLKKYKKLIKKDKTGLLEKVAIPKYITYLKYRIAIGEQMSDEELTKYILNRMYYPNEPKTELNKEEEEIFNILLQLTVFTEKQAYEYLDELLSDLRLMKVNEVTEQKGVAFIINRVFNYIQKLDDDKLVEYLTSDDPLPFYFDLAKVIDLSFYERTVGKPILYWFNTFQPLIAGFLSPHYINYSIWLFKPYIFDRVKEAGKDYIHAYAILTTTLELVKIRYDFHSEWIIYPKDFIKAEKIK